MFTFLRKSIPACVKFRIKCDKLSNIYFLNYPRMLHTAEYLYIAFPDEPIYLKRRQFSDSKTENTSPGTVSKAFGSLTTLFIAFPLLNTDVDFTFVYLQSAISSQPLYRQSAEWKSMNFAHSLGFSENLFVPPRGRLQRGVCIYFDIGDEVEIHMEENILDFLAKDNFSISKITKKEGNSVCITHLNQDNEVEEETYCVIPRQDVPGIGNAVVKLGGNESPIFAIPDVSPVYHSYTETHDILQKCIYIPEVKELLTIAHHHVDKELLGAVQQGSAGKLPHPFVVVEGMDATGKTTLTQLLEDKICAARYFTPPPSIQHLRPYFDKLPEIVRRAYYSMGNYIVTGDIYRECQNRPVIMDRFWHSTTAYGIANETSTGDLPVTGSYVYKWPGDLLRPSLVLFLTVTEEVRKQRLSGRGLASTFEEKSLDTDQLFRYRLCESYRRMEEPACVEIDACGTVEEVFWATTDVLQQHDINL